MTMKIRDALKQVKRWKPSTMYSRKPCYLCGRLMEKGSAGYLTFNKFDENPRSKWLIICPSCHAKLQEASALKVSDIPGATDGKSPLTETLDGLTDDDLAIINKAVQNPEGLGAMSKYDMLEDIAKTDEAVNPFSKPEPEKEEWTLEAIRKRARWAI